MIKSVAEASSYMVKAAFYMLVCFVFLWDGDKQAERKKYVCVYAYRYTYI